MGFVRYVANTVGFLVGMKADEANQVILREACELALDGTINAAKGRSKRWYDTDFAEPMTPKLISTSSFWHLAEYGSINNPAYAPMRRGVEASGCRFTDAYDL